jgi:hypothetical protein
LVISLYFKLGANIIIIFIITNFLIIPLAIQTTYKSKSGQGKSFFTSIGPTGSGEPKAGSLIPKKPLHLAA